MTKPKLTYERSLTQHCNLWFCRGSGSLGLGTPPQQAYWDWRYRMQLRIDQ